MEHVSVLKKEVFEWLDLKEGSIVVDATLGLAGHASGMLELIGKKGILIGFDQDERNLGEAKKRLKKFKNVIYVHDNFRYLKTRVIDALKSNDGKVDAILFDLGFSSPHVDMADRGFSFQKEGPLDMRYSLTQKLTAYDIVNNWPEKKLADILYEYGEERASRKIANVICLRRKEKKFETTTDLAEVVKSCTKWKFGTHGGELKIHPATQVFQALRIAVNDELEALKEALNDSISVLKTGGRMAVISYHSLEDRIVKHFFKELSRSCVCPMEQVVCTCSGKPVVEILTKKPVEASEKEISENPRARSAKMRVVEKL